MSRKRSVVGEKGRDPLIDFNMVQPEDSFEKEAAALEYWIAKQIGAALCGTYKNRQWGVDVDTRNKIIVLMAPSLSKVLGYHIHMRTGEAMPQLIERCRRAAGEILERYGVTRARDTDPLIIEEALKRDFKDNVIASDAVPDKAVKHV